MGSVAWRTRNEASRCCTTTARDCRVQFWVGIERQGPLEMDPRFSIPPYLGTRDG
jgi:hypothetical protein